MVGDSTTTKSLGRSSGFHISKKQRNVFIPMNDSSEPLFPNLFSLKSTKGHLGVFYEKHLGIPLRKRCKILKYALLLRKKKKPKNYESNLDKDLVRPEAAVSLFSS